MVYGRRTRADGARGGAASVRVRRRRVVGARGQPARPRVLRAGRLGARRRTEGGGAVRGPRARGALPKGAAVIVRPARDDDVEAAARVHWLASNTAYGRADDYERRLRSTGDAFAHDDVRTFLAEASGAILGLASVGPDELYALYVHPDHWGTGVGQALIDQAHSALAETCDEARLTVLVGNARARRFYERNGWQLAEQLVEIHFGGEETEVCRYRKRFNSSRS